jgi:hypothetical protein
LEEIVYNLQVKQGDDAKIDAVMNKVQANDGKKKEEDDPQQQPATQKLRLLRLLRIRPRFEN